MNRCIKVLQTSPLATWVRRRLLREVQRTHTEKRIRSQLLTRNFRLSMLIRDGAGNGVRTRDPNLGKVVLYQLSYSRIKNE